MRKELEEPSEFVLDLRPGRATRAQMASHATSSIRNLILDTVKRAGKFAYDKYTGNDPMKPLRENWVGQRADKLRTDPIGDLIKKVTYE